MRFYFGATGGGVWRTDNGGGSWANLSDGFFGGSVGAIAVSEYDPNVIYVGGGEKTLRGNMSSGGGIWKSEDAGRSWQYKGLPESRHIGRIRIHPKNPDLVYAAVMGNPYRPHAERGVYRSTNGGQTWERVLFANDMAGAVDLLLDPTNPRVLYASTWRAQRTPYGFSSGGEGSALWKSTDGGSHWTKLSEREGFPKGTLGIIGVAVSPANPDRVWAMVEAKDGGLFRSDDAGNTWKKLNDDRSLRQRAWYYTRVYADPKDEDGVYVLNVRYHHSQDGGRTFSAHNAPHGDHHDLWIDPQDPKRMVIGDDGGAQVSFDGGQTWSTYHNQPTAQFYRLTTDNAFPYRIYAAQQDNTTIRIRHRSEGGAIGEADWEVTAGGESAHIAVDPEDPDVVYGGSYGGYLTRLDHRTRQERAINVWPDNPMGHGAEGMKYRFQWNFPIFFSPHNPKKLYACSNRLHVTTNEGHSWETISPDLTRNDSTKLGPSGGPITKDNTSVEYYCTIFAAVESPLEEGVIWTGSDDGLLHLTRDGGKTWANVTPPGLPEWAMINCVEASPYAPGGLYLAATSYKTGDFQPYLFKTKDYGKTWIKITEGIDGEHFTRAVRADPAREGLLYAGTESGMYVSFDDGARWQPFQQRLPLVPITDLAVKQGNLIAATQGRGLWIIDDLTPLHQLTAEVAQAGVHLFKPMDAYRMEGRQAKNPRNAGTNHPGGVLVNFYLKNKPDSASHATLEFLEADGDLIRKFDSRAKEKEDRLELRDSTQCFAWDMRYPKAKGFDGMILWWADLDGPKAAPGEYRVRLTVDGNVQEQPFRILKDPRATASEADLQAQFAFLLSVRDKLTETHEAIAGMRRLQGQLSALQQLASADSSRQELADRCKGLSKALKEIEEALYQTKNRSGQDPLNFPIRLNNKLAHLASLAGMGDYAPTEQAIAVRDELVAAIDARLAAYRKLLQEEVPAINALAQGLRLDWLRTE
jgi:photosystem II stability/assembly factor-like uncharacterized protein